MSSSVFLTNDPVVLTNTFTVNNVATDPTTISLTVVNPAGTSTTYTYAAAQITRTSTGVYTKTITADTAGVWRYYWTGTGAAADIEDGDFVVYDPATLTLYAGLDELKSLVGIGDTNDDLELRSALTAACRQIDNLCGRRFYPDLTATARTFVADSNYGVDLLWQGGEFYTTSGLIVATDDAGTGSYSTTWTSSDYRLEPAGGIYNGQSGWPYTIVRTTESGNYSFPVYGDYRRVQITAKWGWAQAPEPIRQAAKILAKDLFKNKDTVGGVAGFDQFGAVRVRMDPMVSMMLDPYKLPAIA